MLREYVKASPTDLFLLNSVVPCKIWGFVLKENAPSLQIHVSYKYFNLHGQLQQSVLTVVANSLQTKKNGHFLCSFSRQINIKIAVKLYSNKYESLSKAYLHSGMLVVSYVTIFLET